MFKLRWQIAFDNVVAAFVSLALLLQALCRVRLAGEWAGAAAGAVEAAAAGCGDDPSTCVHASASDERRLDAGLVLSGHVAEGGRGWGKASSNERPCVILRFCKL